MHVVDKRLLEVIGIMMRRPLTIDEARDLKESYQFIMNREVRHGNILELMNQARQTHDWDWMRKLTPEYRKVLEMY